METSPRVRLEWVPRRRAARSARAASWTSASWNGSLKISFGRSDFACLPRVVALMAAFDLVPVASAIAAHLHGGVLAAGHRSPDQKQVPLGVDLDDVRAALGDPPGPHLAGHLHALENSGGIRARADGAGRPDVVRAVGDRSAAEVVALDRALEALPDR